MNKADSIKKIIKVSIKLFKKYDYEKVSVKNICALSEISIGSFYRLIKSKENLIKMVYEYISLKNSKKVKKIKDKSSIEKIFFLIDVHIESVLHFGYKYYKQFLGMMLDNEIFLDTGILMYPILKKFVSEGIKNNEFTDKYTEDFIYNSIISVIKGEIYEWACFNGETDIKSNLSILLNILMDELRVEK